MRKLIFLAIGGLFATVFTVATYAQNILIWNNANQNSFWCVEDSAVIASDEEIRTALLENGHAATEVAILPENLADVDVIFITLGFAVYSG